ncbi:MAG: C-type lectin domain-containing protein [bacterium]
MDYTNWFPGQGVFGTSQNCMFMHTDQTWWDYPCTYTYYYVCKL